MPLAFCWSASDGKCPFLLWVKVWAVPLPFTPQQPTGFKNSVALFSSHRGPLRHASASGWSRSLALRSVSLRVIPRLYLSAWQDGN